MAELKKCDNELCSRTVKAWVAFCCDPCFLASTHGYEIHETGPLAHTIHCDQRHAERGPYRDPWAPPSMDEALREWNTRPNPGPRSPIRWVGR